MTDTIPLTDQQADRLALIVNALTADWRDKPGWMDLVLALLHQEFPHTEWMRGRIPNSAGFNLIHANNEDGIKSEDTSR